MVLAFFVGLVIATKRSKRTGMSPEKVGDLGLYLILFGALGARILFIAQEWSHYAKHPDELWSLQFQGLTSFGGLIGGFLTLVVYCRRHKIPVTLALDTMGPAVLVSHAIGRVGCLFNGCCYGAPTHAWYGVHQEGLLGHYAPTQLLDSAMCVGLFLLLTWWESRRTFRPGQVFCWAMIAYNVSRFIYEFSRAGTSSTTMGGTPLTVAQVMALAMLVGFAIALKVLKKNSAIPSGEGIAESTSPPKS